MNSDPSVVPGFNFFLLICSSVQNSERGKKIGNAMMTTSRSVVQTGKVVGQKQNKNFLETPFPVSLDFRQEVLSECHC